MKKYGVLLAVILMASAVPASAANLGFYVGGGIGKTTLEVTDFYPELVTHRGGEGQFGYKLYGGYRIFDFLAVEGGLTDFGDVKSWETGSNMIRNEVTIGISGWNAVAVGLIPLGKVDLYGKLGAFSWNRDERIVTVDDDVSESYSGTDLTYTLGIQFNWEHLIVRADADFFTVDEVDSIMMFSISMGWVF
jgi:hypothetical protein